MLTFIILDDKTFSLVLNNQLNIPLIEAKTL